MELTGPARDLHSGLYGGAVPNPLTILTELFAKLHDKNFRVAVPGFYDDVAKLGSAERKALNSLPWKKKDFEKAVGAPAYVGERGFTIVEQLWTRPTLELNGIWGGYTGEGAKTVIPSKAYAKFSTRLVPNQDPQKIAKLVEKHVRKLLPKTVVCKFEVLSTGNPWAAPFHAAICAKAQAALQKGRGPGFARAENLEFANDRLGQQLADVLLDKLGDFLRILVGHQPGGKFGVGLGGNHGLGAFAGVAAPNAVELERGARPKLLHDGESSFAHVSGSTDRFLKIFFLPGQ